MSPKRKPKEVHTKAHYNRSIRSLKQRENFEISKRKVTSHIQGTPTILPTDYSAETLKTKKEWDDILKVLKEKKNPAN